MTPLGLEPSPLTVLIIFIQPLTYNSLFSSFEGYNTPKQPPLETVSELLTSEEKSSPQLSENKDSPQLLFNNSLLQDSEPLQQNQIFYQPNMFIERQSEVELLITLYIPSLISKFVNEVYINNIIVIYHIVMMIQNI